MSKIAESSWANKVIKGDYVEVVSNSNMADVRLMKVINVTSKSIFVSKMRFLKRTKMQTNMERKIKPFMAHHFK